MLSSLRTLSRGCTHIAVHIVKVSSSAGMGTTKSKIFDPFDFIYFILEQPR